MRKLYPFLKLWPSRSLLMCGKSFVFLINSFMVNKNMNSIPYVTNDFFYLNVTFTEIENYA